MHSFIYFCIVTQCGFVTRYNNNYALFTYLLTSLKVHIWSWEQKIKAIVKVCNLEDFQRGKKAVGMQWQKL